MRADGWNSSKIVNPKDGERRGSHVNVLNTAEAMIALIDSGICHAGTSSIRGAVDFLLKHQTVDGKDAGSWPRG